MLGLARSVARGAGSMARGAAGMAKTRTGKFGIGAGIGLGGMAAISGRSSGANGLQAKSSGGMSGM
jgi:hypothetical protein